MTSVSNSPGHTHDARVVYIYCISGVITGGTELLHQLCHALNIAGVETYMVYYPDNRSTVPIPYSNYEVSVKEAIIDVETAVVVLPEALIDLGYHLRNAKKVHWWLSVDNFFSLSMFYLSPNIYLKLWPSLLLKSIALKLKYYRKIRHTKRPILLPLNYIKSINIENAVQSHYAHNFLSKNGFKNLFFLSDYLNSFFLAKENTQRKDVILYNPKKGKKFTDVLIGRFTKFDWIPIQNMSYEEVNNLMSSNKIYVDFGNHPGKDRLPREAALNGLCIITGKRGSAAFYEDVSIPEEFKFDEGNFEFQRFEELVLKIFSDFDNVSSLFDDYRRKIMDEKRVFINEVEQFIARLELKS